MKIKNTIPALFKVINLFLLMGFAVSCDKMNVNPANYSNNVTIEFSADDSSIELGEGTTLHWGISDPDGAVETINFSGGGADQIISLSGSKTVSPTQSTVYYIDALSAKGKILKSIQTKVTVKDSKGAEILEGVSQEFSDIESACDDGVDNDEDGLQDCGDSDCTANEVCAVETPPITEASFTTEPTILEESDLLCIGDSVTITWTSDFSGVLVSVSSGSEKYLLGDAAINGSYTIEVLSDEETTVTLVGDKDYAYSAPFEVVIPTNSTEECNPGFIGKFSAAVYPSDSLIQGEAYALRWQSTDVSEITLGGTHVDLDQDWQDSDIYYATTTKSLNFKLWDNQNPMYTDDSHSLTVTANPFTSAAPQASLSEGVSKVIPGESASKAFILVGNKVVEATNYLTSFNVILDASTMGTAETSGLTGYAVTSNGKTFISTAHYVYLIEGTSAKKIVDFNYPEFSNFTFTFLHAVGKSVIVGSNKALLKLKTKGSCEEDKINDICVEQIDLDGERIGGKTSIFETGDYKTVFKKYTSNSSTVFLVTSEAVYKSRTSGAGFESKVAEIENLQGGSWLGSNGGYIWTNTKVYDYQNSTTGFIEVEGLTSEMSGGEIYFANSYGNRLFVATKNGVYVKNSVGWSLNPVFTSKTSYLTFKNNVSYGSLESMLVLRNAPLGSTTAEYNAVLLTRSGSTATVKYKTAGTLLNIFNATSSY